MFSIYIVNNLRKPLKSRIALAFFQNTQANFTKLLIFIKKNFWEIEHKTSFVSFIDFVAHDLKFYFEVVSKLSFSKDSDIILK